MSATEQLTFFASLDFPGRTTIMLWEMAEKLGCTVKHLLNEAETGSLGGVDLKSASASKRCIRVPIECYYEYVLKRLTGPVDFKMRFLCELPKGTRRQLILCLQESLKS